jgi:hypothetical protein
LGAKLKVIGEREITSCMLEHARTQPGTDGPAGDGLSGLSFSTFMTEHVT